MAAEDVLRVYMAMDNDESDALRVAILEGDFGAVDDSGLTPGERGLLGAAAAEPLPEVSGFAAGEGFYAPARYAMGQYLHAGLTDPGARANFLAFDGSDILP